MLRISLPSWLNFKEVAEVILIDWSSNTDLSWVTYDKRVKYVRVFGEDFFNISQAFNIGIDMAKSDYILKLDVDIILNPFYDFINKYLPSEKEFYRGFWNPSDEIRHQHYSFVIGSFFIQRKNIEKFDILNENYGNEDLDLYRRFIDKGLVEKYYDDDFHIFHTPHPIGKRTENYQNKNLHVSGVWNRRMLERYKRLGIAPEPKNYSIKKIGNIYVGRQT